MPRVLIKHICATSAFISHVFATWRQVKISINLLAIPHWRMCMWTQMLCSSHSIVFGAQFTCISTVKNVHVNSNALLLPLYCLWCSIYVHFHGEECACELKCSASPTLLSSVLNLRAFPRWRMCTWTQMLCSSHSIVFGAQFTCISTVKNVHVNSNSLPLPLYCYRCSITLFLHPLICVADVLCARRGLPMKKTFCMDEGFCLTAKLSDWLQDRSDKCNSAPTRSTFKAIRKPDNLSVENTDTQHCYQPPA
jgi:hypothetical protein